MKLAKGIVFFLLMIMLGSCFNPPEFPIEPQITFKDITFKKGGGLSQDSLLLSLTFKDGDGDLGFDGSNPYSSSYPYHPIDYFLEKDGELTKVATEKVYDNLPPLLRIEAGQSGKLVSVRTRNKPEYSDLPAYVLPYSCSAYNYDTVYISAVNKSTFDKSYNIIDSLVSSNPANPKIYILLDTFYYEYNPNHYNITVQFETKNSDNSYSVFDWREEFCSTYDGRFPVLTENKKVPLDGTLRYSMTSTGFVSLFGGKTLRLKVQIKDRALHPSKPITTPEFKIN